MNFENIKENIKKNLDILINLLDREGSNIQRKESGNRKAIGRCIFHGGDGLNLHILEKEDGYHFKCHTKCKTYGDIFDLLQMKYNLSLADNPYDTLKYLNDEFNLGYDLKPDKATSFKKYIEDKKNTLDSSKYGLCKYENMYFYRDADGIPVMCKIKYRSVENTSKKEFRTYPLIDKGEYYQRGSSEDFKKLEKVIYNYPKVKNAISKGLDIFFVEGEKDADNLNNLGLVATTVYSKINKWESSYSNQLLGARIVFIGDTGEAGNKFKEMIVRNISPISTSFKILNLKGIEELGDNKDVTDWLDAGHTKEELLEIVNRTLDIKNEFELQQDFAGIYYISIKTKIDKDTGEEYEVSRKKIYITNFRVEEANIYRSVDNNSQKIELILISDLNKKATIIADARTLFIDLKSFRKELGIDFTFRGKGDLLPRLQMWILKYFINKDISNYTITGIRTVGDENILVTNNGILKANGTFDTSIKALDNNIHDINFEGMNPLTTKEAQLLSKHLFSFNTPQITYSVLGLAAAQLLNPFARASSLDNMPILQNIGESNSGKSKTFNIIAGMLNISSKPLSYSNLTEFTLLRAFSMTYLPLLIDELKPSKNPIHKLNSLSNHIRNSTEGYRAEKGRKDLTSIEFNYLASMMLSGEELITENAVINRSSISWYSQSNFTDEGANAIEFLVRNPEGNELLRRFSITLYTQILKRYSPEFLVNTYNNVKDRFKFDKITNDRVRNTAIYTMIGILEIANAFKELGVNIDSFMSIEEAKDLIEYNLLDTVLDIDGDKQVSEYEEVLLLIDKLAGTSDLSILISHGEHYKVESSTVSFDFLDIWDRLNLYTSKYERNRTIMSKNEFQKHIRKSKYIFKGDNGKGYAKIRLTKPQIAVDGTRVGKSKPVTAYILKKLELQELGMNNIVPEDEQCSNNSNVISFEEVREEHITWDKFK